MPAATPTAERLTAVLAQIHKAVAAVAEDDDRDLATRYFGVFANRHHLRARILPPSRVPAPGQQLDLNLDLVGAGAANDGDAAKSAASPRRLGWAKLLARVFAVAVTVYRHVIGASCSDGVAQFPLRAEHLPSSGPVLWTNEIEALPGAGHFRGVVSFTAAESGLGSSDLTRAWLLLLPPWRPCRRSGAMNPLPTACASTPTRRRSLNRDAEDVVQCHPPRRLLFG